jgi:outer membrane protein assembly factor BamB
MVTDSSNGLFYGISPDAYFAAYNLEDGKVAFDFLPAFGDKYSRIHVARHGSRMVIAGVERDLDPHRVTRPQQSLVQVVELGSPPKADELGFLSTLLPVGTLRIPEPLLFAASSNDVIVAARTNEIYVMDWNLNVHAALESVFKPHAISLDETGRIYLLADDARSWFLMLLKQGGDRIYTFELPRGTVPSATPPIIGYDHSVYILSSRRVFSVGPNGKQQWSVTTTGNVAGAVVTADNLLLTAEGNEIATYDSKGERKVLFQGDSFVTAPILNSSGELLVASKAALYCLSAH